MEWWWPNDLKPKLLRTCLCEIHMCTTFYTCVCRLSNRQNHSIFHCRWRLMFPAIGNFTILCLLNLFCLCRLYCICFLSRHSVIHPLAPPSSAPQAFKWHTLLRTTLVPSFDDAYIRRNVYFTHQNCQWHSSSKATIEKRRKKNEQRLLFLYFWTEIWFCPVYNFISSKFHPNEQKTLSFLSVRSLSLYLSLFCVCVRASIHIRFPIHVSIICSFHTLSSPSPLTTPVRHLSLFVYV